jgi:hypothetical protein
MTERIFHRVPFHLIEDWLRCGWMVAIPNGPAYHNLYGALLEWRCSCKMPRPR